jgi:hypothetical protein
MNECIENLGLLGFTIDSTNPNDKQLVPPDGTDWRIERNRSDQPFGYRMRGEPPMYNPQFTIRFRDYMIAEVRVRVSSWSTHYMTDWFHETLQSIPAVKMIPEIDVPSDLHGLIEQYLLG